METEENPFGPTEIKPQNIEDKPIVCILIGMAGSGKTTVMQRLNAHVHTQNIPSYVINLDPAVKTLPYEANIDIRDTINYKNVMKEYNLGPNGAIMTSLNLFSTRFDQVIQLVEKKASQLKCVFVDTPGQIEIFNWSASGQIITETFASLYPTVIVYVVDTPRNLHPTTFMSNMLYACGILYKTKLPFLLLFNKCDIASHEYAVKWMTDFDSFQDECSKDSSYMSSLTRSMGLVLEEFYNNLKVVGFSAVTGVGVDKFFEGLEEAKKEYLEVYRPELDQKIAERSQNEEKRKKKDYEKLKKDLEQTRGKNVVLQGSKKEENEMNFSEEEKRRGGEST